VQLNDPLNINVSVDLGGVINDFLKLWEKSRRRAELFQKKMALGNETALKNSVSHNYKSRESMMINQDVMLMDT